MTEVTETELVSKAKAPSVSKEQLEANIVSEKFITEGLLTICVLTLKNGFMPVGHSAYAFPEKYDAEIGKRLAREDALDKVWMLMGYELKTKAALILGSREATDPSFTTYVGTKVVHASPMNRSDYNELRGWGLPENENGADEGYIVEYGDNLSEKNTEEFQGYISWSPKAVFEGSYQTLDYVPRESTFQERLDNELIELVERVTKLTAFLRTPEFNALDLKHQEALLHQKHFMEGYADVLRLRIRYLKASAV